MGLAGHRRWRIDAIAHLKVVLFSEVIALIRSRVGGGYMPLHSLNPGLCRSRTAGGLVERVIQLCPSESLGGIGDSSLDIGPNEVTNIPRNFCRTLIKQDPSVDGAVDKACRELAIPVDG
jgi:hypothetical protein